MMGARVVGRSGANGRAAWLPAEGRAGSLMLADSRPANVDELSTRRETSCGRLVTVDC